MVKLIIVNKKDQVLGDEDKEKCHKITGILHRALCVFIVNQKNELLVQKRSKYKKLWPYYWSNSCCSHPKTQNNIVFESEKRLKEEMGFSTKLKFITKVIYHFSYLKIGSEYELAYIYIGKYDGKVSPNKKEVADYQWINLHKLNEVIKAHPEMYTPWFKLELQELFKKKVLKL